MKGPGGAATGSAECRKHWTTALIHWSSGQGTRPSNAERGQATQSSLERRQIQISPQRYEGTRTQKDRNRIPLPCQTGTHQRVSGAGQRTRLFRTLDILTVKWTTGGVPEECSFLFNTQLVFLKMAKDRPTQIFDEDEWIRSLTEAQEVVADTHNQM